MAGEMEEVKLEENNRSKSKYYTRPLKAKMMSFESLKASQASSVKKEDDSKEFKLENKSSVAQSYASSQVKKEQKEHRKIKSTDPSEEDLCEALMIIKKRLHHRSLQKSIVRLYEKAQIQARQENEIRLEESIVTPVLGQTYEEGEHEPSATQLTEVLPTQSIFNQSGTIPMNASSMSSTKVTTVVLPGKRTSCYHDIAGDIAAPSHEYYKNNPPTLEQIELLERNLSTMPIVSKPRPESLIDQSLKQESSLLTQTTTQEMHYQFKEEETKKKYLNPQEEEKYEGKRSLALLFIQRGFGITKAIDKGLPSIEIGRDQYRNLMGSIIANTFRRLESFLACELKLTIKYLDQEQMKNLHHRLLNCRVYLEPNVCQSFLKFIRIVFGLGNIDISKTEAIELYVGILKLLYGKKITIQTLENMGRISNRRNLKNKVHILKQFAQKEKEKLSKSSFSRVLDNQKNNFDFLNHNIFGNSQAECSPGNPANVWSSTIERQMINLYVSCRDLNEIKRFMETMFKDLSSANYDLAEYENRICILTREGLERIEADGRKLEGLQLKPMRDSQIDFILQTQEGANLKREILSYLLTQTGTQLQHCISLLNHFTDSSDQNQSELKIEEEVEEEEEGGVGEEGEEYDFLTYQDQEFNEPSFAQNLFSKDDDLRISEQD